jgi:hypothetical protein
MPATTWRCECGATDELPETALGRKVRCSPCGTVSLLEKRSSKNVPPPLPKTTVASGKGGGKLKSTHGQPQVGVAGGSKKPILVFAAVWAHVILVSVTLSLALLLSLFVFFGDNGPQPGLQVGEPLSAKQLDKDKEGTPAVEDEEKPNYADLSSMLLKARLKGESAIRAKENLENRNESKTDFKNMTYAQLADFLAKERRKREAAERT